MPFVIGSRSSGAQINCFSGCWRLVSLDLLISKAKDEFDSLVRLTSELVSVPSVNPPGDVSDAVGYVKDFLNSIGVKYSVYEPKKGVITVYTYVGEGDVDYLHFNGHLDVVPPGDADKWRYEPFSGIVRDGYIYGRGSSDMKGGVAVLLKTMELLARYWEDIPYRIGLSMVPDEETGSDLGTQYIISELGVRPKYVLIPEPSTIYLVEIGEKGVYHFTVRAGGYPAHGSLSPHVGDNAIMKLFRVIEEMYGLTKLEVSPPHDLEDVVEESGAIVAEKFGKESLRKLYKTLSCNVGVIRGGDKVNIVAPWAEAEIDIRIPPGMTLNDLKGMLDEIMSKYGDIIIISGKGIDPSYTSPESKLVSSVVKAAERELGIDIKYHLVAGATDARFFRRVGSDAIIYGPGDPGSIHSYDERISIDDLRKAFLVYVDVVWRMIS